jgi:hypothetical protein
VFTALEGDGDGELSGALAESMEAVAELTGLVSIPVV